MSLIDRALASDGPLTAGRFTGNFSTRSRPYFQSSGEWVTQSASRDGDPWLLNLCHLTTNTFDFVSANSIDFASYHSSGVQDVATNAIAVLPSVWFATD